MKKPHHFLGQTLIEFSILLPILLLLVVGLFEIGRVIFYFAVLNTAVREGTRFAIIQPGCDYTADPSVCTGSYLSDENLENCDDASSAANIRICEEITNNYFFIGELASSKITIEHTVNSTDDPIVHIRIEFDCEPSIPGLGLIGTIPIHVNSQMLLSPVAKP